MNPIFDPMVIISNMIEYRIIHRMNQKVPEPVQMAPKSSVKRENEDDEFSSLVSIEATNAAQQFYNKRDRTKEERLQSSVLHLRNLNNWIKLALINTYCQEKSRVLDLACGKGGDLKKWKERSIYHYVGVDIADGSIADAVNRFKNMPNAGFPARFAVANLGKCDLSTFLNTVALKRESLFVGRSV